MKKAPLIQYLSC